MNAEDLGHSKLLNLLFKPAGRIMESRLRHRLHDPESILQGAGVQPGETVLEVGSGTGFFTLPAARLIGEHGRLIAMETLSSYVERLRAKIEAEGLRNVEVVQRDALKTGLDDASIDKVLLFGVVPTPSLPLKQLLPEMHRVLKPEGTLALWMFPAPGWVPRSIRRSGLFTALGRRNGVFNYRRTDRN